MTLCVYFVLLLVMSWGAVMLLLRTHGKFRFLLTGLAFLAALLGYAGSIVGDIQYPMLYSNLAEQLLKALPMSLAIAIVLAFCSFPILRLTNPFGTIDPFLPAALLALVFGSSMIAFLGWQIWSNGWFDESPAKQEQAFVSDKFESYGRSGKCYELELQIDEKSGRVRVERELFDSLKIGAKLNIQVRAGYQETPWAEKYSQMQ